MTHPFGRESFLCLFPSVLLFWKSFSWKWSEQTEELGEGSQFGLEIFIFHSLLNSESGGNAWNDIFMEGSKVTESYPLLHFGTQHFFPIFGVLLSFQNHRTENRKIKNKSDCIKQFGFEWWLINFSVKNNSCSPAIQY